MAGALIHFIAAAPSGEGRRGGFQPMPPNFGLLPELPQRIREKRLRYGAYRDRALADLEATRAKVHPGFAQAPLPLTVTSAAAGEWG
jgi:methylenetetrahydrofolate--tRNA-(uracil-5-)-methyltransferase